MSIGGQQFAPGMQSPDRWFRRTRWLIPLLSRVPFVGVPVVWRSRPSWPGGLRYACYAWGAIGTFLFIGGCAPARSSPAAFELTPAPTQQAVAIPEPTRAAAAFVAPTLAPSATVATAPSPAPTAESA